MEEQINQSNRPVNPRRKKRSKIQVFKENYLPVIIAGIAIILIIIFIIGSITRAVQKSNAEKAAKKEASSAAEAEQKRLEEAAQNLIAKADEFIAIYDYQGAIDALNSFEGDISDYPSVNDKILECEAAQRNLVTWADPSQIPNLSFQLLVADATRGFNHSTYGYSINRNFITTGEFSKILQQLYDNGYILVDFEDFTTTEVNASGDSIYKIKPLQLPKGKKPIMLTQTNVNYNYYLIDSNNDKVPDAGGTGIASKLLWDGNEFTCEMVDANGNIITGDFDLVPILEKFINRHPDFSYRGARATLALTGYNGLFGYRTHPSAKELFGEDAYNKDLTDVKKVATALTNAGYKLACYTYENISYNDASVTQIKGEMNKWNDEVVSILGKINTFTFAQNSDISTDPMYSGAKYETLHENGFRYYIGFSTDGKPWTTITDSYVRQGRIMVTGSNLAHKSEWFITMFDASSILDANRGNVPS